MVGRPGAAKGGRVRGDRGGGKGNRGVENEGGADGRECEAGAQEAVLRASARVPSGEATAAASAGVNRRTTEELVAAPSWSIAEPGQMSRMAEAAGASMVMITPSPA